MLGICLDTNIRISIFLSMSLPSKSSQIGFRPPPRVAIVGPKGWLCELLALKAGEKVHSKVLQVSDPAFFCRFCSFNLSLAWNELGYHNKCHSTTSDSVIDEEFVGLIKSLHVDWWGRSAQVNWRWESELSLSAASSCWKSLKLSITWPIFDEASPASPGRNWDHNALIYIYIILYIYVYNIKQLFVDSCDTELCLARWSKLQCFIGPRSWEGALVCHRLLYRRKGSNRTKLHWNPLNLNISINSAPGSVRFTNSPFLKLHPNILMLDNMQDASADMNFARILLELCGARLRQIDCTRQDPGF